MNVDLKQQENYFRHCQSKWYKAGDGAVKNWRRHIQPLVSRSNRLNKYYEHSYFIVIFRSLGDPKRPGWGPFFIWIRIRIFLNLDFMLYFGSRTNIQTSKSSFLKIRYRSLYICRGLYFTFLFQGEGMGGRSTKNGLKTIFLERGEYDFPFYVKYRPL